jgi:hypothetical protein
MRPRLLASHSGPLVFTAFVLDVLRPSLDVGGRLRVVHFRQLLEHTSRRLEQHRAFRTQSTSLA